MTRESSSISAAVIGAGLAGLTAARGLLDAGHAVRVFDKGRGAGGRMSTRRQDGLEFDHGAQFFTVRNEHFRSAVERWRTYGLAADWSGSIGTVSLGSFELDDSGRERLVAVPRMSALCRSLAGPIGATFGTVVSDVTRENRRWILRSDEGRELGAFDRVIVSTPPEQAVPLLGESPELAAQAASVEMLPCWAVMIAFCTPLTDDWDAALVADSPLSWIARNSSKPGRPSGDSWVLHGSPEWSSDHVADERSRVGRALIDAFFEATRFARSEPVARIIHRWRYARAKQQLGTDYLYDEELGIGVCGDWCRGDRVEDAYLSGLGLGGRMA